MSEELKLEEHALSQAAERTISNQLDTVENIDINVRTDFLKMLQGQADSVSVSGQGLVMQKDIRVQEMELHTDSIDINLFKALFGDIHLNQPVNATIRFVFTEQDINRALSSDYIRNKLQKLELHVEGEVVTIEPQQIEIYLPSENKIECRGTISLQEKGNSQQANFSTLIRPRTQTQPIILEKFNCHEGGGFSLEFIVAFMQKLKELVNLQFLEIEGIAFRIKEMSIAPGRLTLLAEAHVRQLPPLPSSTPGQSVALP